MHYVMRRSAITRNLEYIGGRFVSPCYLPPSVHHCASGYGRIGPYQHLPPPLGCKSLIGVMMASNKVVVCGAGFLGVSPSKRP